MRISSLTYLTGQGFKNIWHNRIMSVASFCVLVVSMLLVGVTMLFIDNINTMVGSIEDKNEVIIFLDDDISLENIDLIGDKLRNMPNVSQVTFYSKEQAFSDMKARMDNAEELFEYIGDDSPLPDSYRLKIVDIDSMSGTLMEINRLDNIYSIKAPTDFVNVLTGLKSVIAIVTVAIIGALVVVSLVIISNATRASVSIRKREISIMKYVGATNNFIKVPFFIEGVVIGILSGVVAFFLTWFGYDSLVGVLVRDTTFLTALGISGFLSFQTIAVRMCIVYIVAGSLIAGIGTLISTRKYVKV